MSKEKRKPVKLPPEVAAKYDLAKEGLSRNYRLSVGQDYQVLNLEELTLEDADKHYEQFKNRPSCLLRLKSATNNNEQPTKSQLAAMQKELEAAKKELAKIQAQTEAAKKQQQTANKSK